MRQTEAGEAAQSQERSRPRQGEEVMMRTHTLTTVGLAMLIAAALIAAPAGAYLVRPVSSFPIGPEGNGVAVEQAKGDVFVSIGSSASVEKLSGSGQPEASFVSPPFVGGTPFGVAVDNSGGASKGDVYVALDGSAGRVVKLDASGKEVSGFTPIAASSIPAGDPGSENFEPSGVAVDSANGDVVVASGGEVDIFSSSGTFISQFAVPGVRMVAVGSGSEIFTDSNGSGAETLEWSPADGYAAPTALATGPLPEKAPIAVDAVTGDLFVRGENEQEQQYIAEDGASGMTLSQFGLELVNYSAGIAVDEKTDTVYASSPEAGLVYIFGAEFLAKAVTGTPATGVTVTSADVSGTVDPEGLKVSACRFEYGLSTSYEASAPCSPASPLTGEAAIPVTATLHVQAGKTYHYRLVAVTASGSSSGEDTAGGSSYGEDETFQTPVLPPSIDGESASAVAQSAATLNASINPNSETTTYHFEYGTSMAYGTTVPVPDASIGSGYGDVNVGQQLTGLAPDTTYHFRVVATNATSPPGGTDGPDETFTTPPPEPPVVSTGQAEGVGQSTATLTAAVDTQGFETVYEFDFGPDTSYGIRIFGNAGSEPGTQTFKIPLQGLAPGTTYHYRIAATNAFGTVYGVDVTFTTASYPSAVLSEPVALPLVPALLLAPEPPAGGAGTATAARVLPAAHTARHANGRASSARKRTRGRHRRGGRSVRVGHAEGAGDRGGR
jgi:hypothetical protein